VTRRGPLPRLHAITDERIARRPDLDVLASRLAQAGAGLAIHARGRALTGLEHYDLSIRLSGHPPIRLFVNDRLDVALSVGAEGVHLAEGSLGVEEARRLGPDWWIGCSVHDLAGARAASRAGADYLLVGPVYHTTTHPDVPPLGPVGLEAFSQLGLPVIAIGGVTPERVAETRRAGAYGVAAIRALWDADDPAAAAAAMLQELGER
jgi:thiamine-phosphate pyrophosphorylase